MLTPGRWGRGGGRTQGWTVAVASPLTAAVRGGLPREPGHPHALHSAPQHHSHQED